MDESKRDLFVERPTAIVAAEGWPFVVPLVAATALLFAFGPLWLAIAVGALTLFVVAFFRNPRREIPGDEATVVSPADGRVLVSTRSKRRTAAAPSASASGSSSRCSTCT